MLAYLQHMSQLSVPTRVIKVIVLMVSGVGVGCWCWCVYVCVMECLCVSSDVLRRLDTVL